MPGNRRNINGVVDMKDKSASMPMSGNPSGMITTEVVYRMLPTASIDALTALAHAETNSSDEVGEFFSMADAVKVPAAQVPPDSVVIIPLGPPDIGIEADMPFLFTTPFMFLRLHGIPQPLLFYGHVRRQ